MRLGDKDEIVDLEVTEPLPDLAEGEEADEATATHGMLLTVTEKGFGKAQPAPGLPASRAGGGSGVINIRAGVRNGKVVGSVLVKPGEGCLLISQEGMVIRFDIDTVRKTGRAAMGVRLLNLVSDTDRVVGLAKIDASAPGPGR